MSNYTTKKPEITSLRFIKTDRFFYSSQRSIYSFLFHMENVNQYCSKVSLFRLLKRCDLLSSKKITCRVTHIDIFLS